MATGREHARLTATEGSHRVTPAELFFDLVFVYAITQVTALMADHPSGLRIIGGLVVLALLWWCWCCFAWLGNVVRADSGALLSVLVAVMAVMLIVSLTVPEVYTDSPEGLPAPLLFVLCYGAVRLLHLITYWVSDPGDLALRATLRRTTVLSVVPPFVLLLIGSALSGTAQVLVWAGAMLVDYAAVFVTGSSGWHVTSPGHFAERHGLIVIIALGESIVSIGVGVSGLPLTGPALLAAVTGLLVAAGLWRLYFTRVGESAEHRLAAEEGDDRTRFARDVYTFLHLPLVAGIVLTALGMKKALHQIADREHYDLSEPLHGLPGWALTGGVGLFLLAAAVIRLRTTRRGQVLQTGAGLLCVAAGALVVVIPALAALAMTALIVAVVLRFAPPRGALPAGDGGDPWVS